MMEEPESSNQYQQPIIIIETPTTINNDDTTLATPSTEEDNDKTDDKKNSEEPSSTDLKKDIFSILDSIAYSPLSLSSPISHNSNSNANTITNISSPIESTINIGDTGNIETSVCNNNNNNVENNNNTITTTTTTIIQPTTPVKNKQKPNLYINTKNMFESNVTIINTTDTQSSSSHSSHSLLSSSPFTSYSSSQSSPVSSDTSSLSQHDSSTSSSYSTPSSCISSNTSSPLLTSSNVSPLSGSAPITAFGGDGNGTTAEGTTAVTPQSTTNIITGSNSNTTTTTTTTSSSSSSKPSNVSPTAVGPGGLINHKKYDESVQPSFFFSTASIGLSRVKKSPTSAASSSFLSNTSGGFGGASGSPMFGGASSNDSIEANLIANIDNPFSSVPNHLKGFDKRGATIANPQQLTTLMKTVNTAKLQKIFGLAKEDIIAINLLNSSNSSTPVPKENSITNSSSSSSNSINVPTGSPTQSPPSSPPISPPSSPTLSPSWISGMSPARKLRDRAATTTSYNDSLGRSSSSSNLIPGLSSNPYNSTPETSSAKSPLVNPKKHKLISKFMKNNSNSASNPNSNSSSANNSPDMSSIRHSSQLSGSGNSVLNKLAADSVHVLIKDHGSRSSPNLLSNLDLNNYVLPASAKESLGALMKDKVAYELFKQFCKRESSLCNLLFIEEIEKLHGSNASSDHQIQDEVERIFNRYIVEESENDINIDKRVYYQIHQGIRDKASLSVNYKSLFDKAYRIIKDEVTMDSFRRFVNQYSIQSTPAQMSPATAGKDQQHVVSAPTHSTIQAGYPVPLSSLSWTGVTNSLSVSPSSSPPAHLLDNHHPHPQISSSSSTIPPFLFNGSPQSPQSSPKSPFNLGITSLNLNFEQTINQSNQSPKQSPPLSPRISMIKPHFLKDPKLTPLPSSPLDSDLLTQTLDDMVQYGVAFGFKRGACKAPCDCLAYQSESDKGGICLNCGHYPASHKNLGKISNYIDIQQMHQQLSPPTPTSFSSSVYSNNNNLLSSGNNSFIQSSGYLTSPSSSVTTTSPSINPLFGNFTFTPDDTLTQLSSINNHSNSIIGSSGGNLTPGGTNHLLSVQHFDSPLHSPKKIPGASSIVSDSRTRSGSDSITVLQKLITGSTLRINNVNMNNNSNSNNNNNSNNTTMHNSNNSIKKEDFDNVNEQTNRSHHDEEQGQTNQNHSETPGQEQKKEEEELDRNILMNFNSWTIDGDEIIFLHKLGEGTSAKVYKATWRNQEVAVKVLKSEIESQKLQDFLKELEIMSSLRSPHVVYFYGMVLEPKICIIMEYCSNQTLYHLMHLQMDFTWDWVFKFSIEMVRGINCLHSWKPSIVHRDLKSLNLLVSDNWTIKVADFGLSRFASSKTSSMRKTRGTYAYCAPEVFFGINTTKGDIYSIAIVLWEMAVRCVKSKYEKPFSEFKQIQYDFQILVQTSKHQLRPTIPPNCPEGFAQLINRCWDQSPESRPTCPEILDSLLDLERKYNENRKKWDKVREKPKK